MYIYITYIVYTYGPSFDACVLVIINSCKFKFDLHHIILAVATESEHNGILIYMYIIYGYIFS